MSLKYFSMFSGIGGFELGIQRAFMRYKNEGLCQPTSTIGDTERSNQQLPELGVEGLSCIGYSEIDKYAIKVYERNFNGHKNYGDATGINPENLPPFDLVVGGFPCQSFSVAGKRRGFNDTRGTLFFDIARVLKHKRPRHLVLENVKGLLSHDCGKTFQTILGVLSDLGYRVEWQVLNSKNFGVPQNRERIYIVGHLRDECRGQIFPIGDSNGPHFQQKSQASGKRQRIRGSDISGAIDANYHKGTGSTRQMIAEKPYIVHNVYGGFNETKPREFHNVSPTIRTPKGGGHLPMLKEGARIRRLTPKECERLQGFPDNWTAIDGEGGVLSDTQRYKMAGNAVTVNTVQAVMESLFKNCVV